MRIEHPRPPVLATSLLYCILFKSYIYGSYYTVLYYCIEKYTRTNMFVRTSYNTWNVWKIKRVYAIAHLLQIRRYKLILKKANAHIFDKEKWIFIQLYSYIISVLLKRSRTKGTNSYKYMYTLTGYIVRSSKQSLFARVEEGSDNALTCMNGSHLVNEIRPTHFHVL